MSASACVTEKLYFVHCKVMMIVMELNCVQHVNDIRIVIRANM